MTAPAPLDELTVKIFVSPEYHVREYLEPLDVDRLIEYVPPSSSVSLPLLGTVFDL